jgi:integrase
MATVFLRSTRRIYYRRVHIPKRIRHHFRNKVEVWKSLKTAEREEASLRAAQFDVTTQRLFLTLTKHGDHMTKDQIEALVNQWLESALDEAEDDRATCGLLSENALDEIDTGLSETFDSVEEDLLSCDYRRITPEADALLTSAGIPPLDHASVAFGRLCRGLLLAKREFLQTEADRWDGKYVNHHPATAATSSVQGEKTAKAPTQTGPLFSVVVEKYLAENPRAARMVKPLKAELKKFVETIGGDRPISSITKAEARAYKEDLLSVRKLSALTIVKHLSALHTLFQWASSQGFVEDGYNPIKGLAPSKKIAHKQMKKRRPFTDDELLQVFGSKDFIQQRKTNPARYWLCLICLFSACRREEAGQLAVADIQEEDGIRFFWINDDPKLEQTLKNEGSRRRVVVHSSLIKLGFLEFVKKVKAAGHARLFHEFKKGGNGYSDSTGKYFGRLVTKVGLHDPALVLHSLRTGGITKMHGAGVPHNVVEYLVGHSAGTVHDRVYTKRDLLPLSLLREGLEKLRYDEVVQVLWQV